MLRKLLVGTFAVFTAFLPARSEELLTLQQYTQYLLDTYGGNAQVLTGTINGIEFPVAKPEGSPFTELYPQLSGGSGRNTSPIYALSATLVLPSPCTDILYSSTAGAFKKKWCASNRVIATVVYEARRDTYYFSLGSWSYIQNAAFFDCQNASDLAAMPEQVKDAVC